ncbi:MAG: hypothetical protein OEZ34_14565 [Spirochaetia bacterium]|nr:hypothetical protein [Spirochaetia bacterium]
MKYNYTENKLKEMISQYVDPLRIPKKLKIITDTSNFFQMDYNDVLILEDRAFLIRNCEKEGRFTIDEQPKFWVRKAVDLTDGTNKIIKMVFHETYNARVGNLIFECFRSPKKESQILDLTRSHENFMQGFSLKDSAGNLIRIIDFIQGKNLTDTISALDQNHEDYFYSLFPEYLDRYMELVRAVQFLHANGEKHGDIRRDHILIEKETGLYKWIDFDYNFFHKENMFGFDLFGLGNVLVFLAAGDELTLQNLKQTTGLNQGQIKNEDLNIIFNNRIVNLKKVYPYIPDSLNRIFLHFSKGAEVFYDDTEQLLDDLMEAKNILTFQ